MPHYVDYPKREFTEDTEGSADYARMSTRSGARVGNYLKIAAAIFWCPWILSFFGIVHISSTVFIFSIGGGLALFIVGMVRAGREEAVTFATCRQCGETLRRESHQSCDFYVCDCCETFIRGGDFS